MDGERGGHTSGAMIQAMQRCGGCRRHLAAIEVRCPFCSARVGLVGAGPLAVFALALAGMSAACSDRSLSDGGSADDSSTGGATGMGSNTQSTSAGSVTTTATAEASTGAFDTGSVDTGNDVDTSPTSAGFIYGAPDGGNLDMECDVWAQDCPKGEKCMPWANDGGASWNATRCSPVDVDPNAPGEACTVEGSGVSGIDDCELRAMCWGVDPDTLMGECVAQCGGTEGAPECPDGTGCVISNEGVLTLCLATCDPMDPMCAQGEVCAPNEDGFFCVPASDGGSGQHGDDCEVAAVCDPGLVCVAGENVAGCATTACCTEWCDTTLPSDMQCAGFSDGEVCDAWYDEGEAPEGFETLGSCVLPS